MLNNSNKISITDNDSIEQLLIINSACGYIAGNENLKTTIAVNGTADIITTILHNVQPLSGRIILINYNVKECIIAAHEVIAINSTNLSIRCDKLWLINSQCERLRSELDINVYNSIIDSRFIRYDELDLEVIVNAKNDCICEPYGRILCINSDTVYANDLESCIIFVNCTDLQLSCIVGTIISINSEITECDDLTKLVLINSKCKLEPDFYVGSIYLCNSTINE